MKNFYLYLVVTAVVVTCDPQRSNNDIIWFPVDDEGGVFISSYGEKHRSTPVTRPRQQKRSSGSENETFSTNDTTIPLKESPFVRTRVFALLQKKFPHNPFFTLKQLFSERYQDKNSNQAVKKLVPTNSNYLDQSGSSKGTQFNGLHQSGNNNINQIENSSGTSPTNELPFENKFASSQSTERIEVPKRNRTIALVSVNSDAIIFPESEKFTPTLDIPMLTSPLSTTEPPPYFNCELQCRTTNEFNPVCGTNQISYFNAGRLKCAKMCGIDVEIRHYGKCRNSKMTSFTSGFS